MGDIGPVQQRYDVLPVDEPAAVPAPVPEPHHAPERGVPERAAR